MIKVYKFDTFDSYIINPYVLTASGGILKESFRMIYMKDVNYWVIPLPKETKVENVDSNSKKGTLKLKELVNSINVDFTFGDKLFIHPNCTIPRAKVTQKYTKVLKSDNADICVVPVLKDKVKTELMAIFVNKLKGKIYTIMPKYNYICTNNIEYFNAEVCKNYSIGSKPTDINPSLYGSSIDTTFCYNNNKKVFTNENWKDFLESSLIYCGNAICVSNNEKWIGDYLYKTIHHVVTEDKILATLSDETNAINKDTYDSIKEMLKSSDKTIVGLGLKTLAEMDYEKYFNTAIHLLNNVGKNWRNNPMKQNVSVKYMLKFLGNWDYTGGTYTNHIEQEDFDVFQQVIEDDFKNRFTQLVSNFKKEFPFALIDIQHSLSISSNLCNSKSISVTENKENKDY